MVNSSVRTGLAAEVSLFGLRLGDPLALPLKHHFALELREACVNGQNEFAGRGLRVPFRGENREAADYNMIALRREGRPLRAIAAAMAAKSHKISHEGVAGVLKAAGAVAVWARMIGAPA